VNYFALFAYMTFICGIIYLLGGALYLADLYLDPEEDDAPSGRHAAEYPVVVRP